MSRSLRKFAALGTQLCLQACNILNESHHNKNLKKYMKGFQDPVTQADFKVQTMLTQGFRTHYPNLHIIGQESTEYLDSLEIDYVSMLQKDNSFFPSYVGLEQQLSFRNSLESCLWIDPLDCTNGFINGKPEDVTVLIGLSVGKNSHFGIIGTPFKNYNGKVFYDPSIVIGSIGVHEAYEYTPFHRNSWTQLKRKSQKDLSFERNSQNLRVTTSSFRSNYKQNYLIKGLEAENIQAGGSGRKIMMVIKQEADLMTCIDSTTHLWDSCAGEAIVKAMGGEFVTPNQTSIKYDVEKAEVCTKNTQGMVCTLNPEVYQRTMALLQNIGMGNQTNLKIQESCRQEQSKAERSLSGFENGNQYHGTNVLYGKNDGGQGYGEFLAEVVV